MSSIVLHQLSRSTATRLKSPEQHTPSESITQSYTTKAEQLGAHRLSATHTTIHHRWNHRSTKIDRLETTFRERNLEIKNNVYRLLTASLLRGPRDRSNARCTHGLGCTPVTKAMMKGKTCGKKVNARYGYRVPIVHRYSTSSVRTLSINCVISQSKEPRPSSDLLRDIN